MIIFVGIASSFLVLPPNKVIRADGTIVKLEAASKPHEEAVGLLRLFKDWRMLGEFAIHAEYPTLALPIESLSSSIVTCTYSHDLYA